MARTPLIVLRVSITNWAFPGDPRIVVRRVVGHNQHAVILGKIVARSAVHDQVVMAAAPDKGEIGVVYRKLRHRVQEGHWRSSRIGGGPERAPQAPQRFEGAGVGDVDERKVTGLNAGQSHIVRRDFPKVVGGIGPVSSELAGSLYGKIFNRTVPVSSPAAAEMTKLLENIYRCVNIALVNELKQLCERMGIDLFEVIEAAKTKPFGFHAFYPGPGLGGHCIPIDPFYLSWKAKQFDFHKRFIELAGEVNMQMPYYVIEKTQSRWQPRPDEPDVQNASDQESFEYHVYLPYCEQVTMSVKLSVEDLRKSYGEVRAVDRISFCVEGGEILGLLGPNGAGKTTIVESIAGLCKPDSGRIEVCGVDVRRYPRETKRRMGFALAVTALQDKITPREALDSFGGFYQRRAAVNDLIERFDLGSVADRYFEALSTGQKQRLALALALVNEPELLILDEPSAGLDPEARRNVHSCIMDVKRSGGTVLMTTHDMDEAKRLCDRIAIINFGRVVAEGSPANLIAQSRTTTTISVRLQSDIIPEALAEMRSINGLECEGTLVRFVAMNVNEALAQLISLLNRNGLEIAEMHAQRATLEEVVASYL